LVSSPRLLFLSRAASIHSSSISYISQLE
jgi:hypothetical protein